MSSELAESGDDGVRIGRYLKDGGKIVAGAAGKVVSRTIGWGLLGLASAQVIWALCFFLGAFDDGIWGAAAIAWFVTTVVGTIAVGYAGFWRGVGAMVLYLTIDKGLLQALLDNTLGRVLRRIADSPRFAGAIDKARGLEATWATWHEVTNTALADRRTSALANVRQRGMRGWVVRKFWRTVFATLGGVAERVFATEDGTRRISGELVQETLSGKLTEGFRDRVEGYMNRQLMIFGGLYLAVTLVVVYLVA